MMLQPTPLGDKLAGIARFILVGAIAVIASLIALGPQRHGVENPISVRSAQAAGGGGGIAAAPGYLLLTTGVGQTDKLVLVDNNNQVICIYTLHGSKLRLVVARKFDYDSQIFDASVNIPGIRPFEGTDGIDRDTAKTYSEKLKELWEKKPK